MGDFTTASSTSSAAAGAEGALVGGDAADPWLATCATGAAAGMAGRIMDVGMPAWALRTRIFKPSRSSSNSASSCSRTSARMRSISSNSISESYRHVRQWLAAFVDYHHVVFDPHATHARHVGAGFDRKDHPGLHWLVGRRLRRDARLFVHFKAEPVTRAVAESGSEAVSLQHLA